MKKHFYLLVNQKAGSGYGKRTAEKLITQLKSGNLPFTAYYTEYAGHEKELVQQLATDVLIPWTEQQEQENFPLLVVLGGDGTLHHVLNALAPFDATIPVAYIPCGSGNDFARGIGIHKQPEKAFVQLLKAQSPKPLSIIHYKEAIQEIEGFATNNVGLGIDAAIVEKANRSTRKHRLNKFRLGSLAYIFSVLSVLFTQKGFPVLAEINGRQITFKRAFLCTVTNHPYFGGGVAIAPMADPYKESLDLVIVERVHFLKLFWLICLLLRKKQMHSKYFHHFQSKKIRVVSTIPEFIHTDGEILGKNSCDLSFWTEKRLFWF